MNVDPKALAGLTPEQKRALLQKLLAERSAKAAPPALGPRPRGGPLLASYAQERLWLLDQLDPGSSDYNIASAFELRGELDVEALGRVLTALQLRHETLRTELVGEAGGVRQRLHPSALLALEQVDLSGEQDPLSAALRRAEEDVRRGFALDRAPLFRTQLMRLGEGHHLWLITLHNTIVDGFSLGVLLEEVSALYAAERGGAGAGLAPLEIQFADYAAWEREVLTPASLEGSLRFWTGQLEGAPERLELPTEARPSNPDFERASHLVQVPPGLANGLRRLAQREGVTLFMLLEAVFRAFLSRHTGVEDLVVGTPIAGRSRAETERLIGCFENTLAIRVPVRQAEPFRALLGRVRAGVLDAFAHQAVPFDWIVNALQPVRDPHGMPVVQVIFGLQQHDREALRLEGLDVVMHPIDVGKTKFELTLQVFEEGDESLTGIFVYRTDLFDRARVEALGAGWVRVLEEVVRRPEARLYELPVGGESAELSAGRGEEVSVWGGSFAEKFAEVAKARGDAPAVRCGAETVSYGELLKRARGCGEALREAGVKEESLVALLGQRGAGLVTAILGVWEAGGAYLPLDPEHPAKRVRQILEGSGASVVVVGEGERALLEEALAGMEKPPAVLSLEEVTRRERAEGLGLKRARQALAYVIYTSGSTGEPKGVMVEEEGMVNHLQAKVRELSLGEGEVVAQNASQCFDISVWQMLVGLWVGGVTEVVGKEEAASPRGLMEVVEERGVTVLEVVPSMLKAMVEEVEGGKKPGFEKLRWLVATGEALSPQTCGRWLEEYPGIPVVNAYGPTECSDDVTHAFLREAPKGANAPVGKALPNLQTWVLGKELEVMPVGVPGELHVGGVGVGRGYLGRPDLTAERFVPDPYGKPGARLYRTGDLVKRLADGSVEYLGRVDHQVKVRGFRIELGEIEKVLGKVEGVKDCVVVALGEGGDKQLVGYVVGEVEASEVKAALRERLPEYMVPAAVVKLEALPLTANGKVDRKKLPAPEGGVAEYVAPRSPLEELVAGIWARVLKLERVGATDNFFELGGHSLLAMKVTYQLQQQLGAEVPLRILFEQPTVEQLACAIEPLAAPTEARAPGARQEGT